MPLTQGKKTVGATVTVEVREKIKRVAELKHWSVAQTLGLFIDAYWSQWEKDLGVDEKPKAEEKPGKKTRKPTAR
jgi:hypothetical protein